MSDERVMAMGRAHPPYWRSAVAAVASSAAMAVAALAAPLPASAAAHATAAGSTTHVFSISYDGKGTYNYTAEGANGLTGCKMHVSNEASYGFDQLWTVKIAFKRNGNGGYAAKVISIRHVDGPQQGDGGASNLVGKQTKESGQNCADGTIVPDTGKFDCTSSTLTLTAFPNPQMVILKQAGDLVLLGRAFVDGHWKYSGSDSIPGDKKKCATYDDHVAYGSDFVVGIGASAKITMTVKALAKLAKKHPVTEDVNLFKNLEYPPQTTCDATFGAPNFCVLHKQTLSGKFTLSRIK